MITAIQPDSHIQVKISLRPIVVPDDLRFIQQWVGVHAGSLIPFYESIAVSSFMKAMMAWDHDQPVLQADMCEALFDDLGTGERIRSGDYTLRLLFAPNACRSAIEKGLYSCMEYLFKDKQASRILIPVYRYNKVLIDWVKAVNCMLSPGIIQKPLHNLYLLTNAAWKKGKREETSNDY